MDRTADERLPRVECRWPGNLPARAARLLMLSLIGLLVAAGAASAATAGLERALTDYIKSHYPWAEVEVTDIDGGGQGLSGMPERVVLERGLPGRTVFRTEYADGRQATVTANVRAFDNIVMSRRPLQKGAYLHKDDLYVRLMDVANIPKNSVGIPDMLIGKALTRSIVANRPIVKDMVSEAPQIRKGQRVSLVFEAGGLNITAMGEMKESAFVGSFVRAVNVSSKKIVAGVLMDENTVKVEF